MKYAFVAALLMSSAALAEIPPPPRPVTDPRSIVSPVDPLAAPVPIPDLVFSRGLFDAAWSADGRQIFVSTNLTGRYNIWRTDADGSWPVQLTQSEDAQSGFVVSPDGRTLFYEQDQGGNEQYDIYAVPTNGGAPRNLTNTPEVRENALLISPDGRSIAMAHKLKTEGQNNLPIFDIASGKTRLLTHEAEARWNWSPVAWTNGGRTLIVNRNVVDGSVGEVWRVDVASGKATRLLGQPGVVFCAGGGAAPGSAVAVTTHQQTKPPHPPGVLPPTGGGPTP